ncbi:MAG: GNAT family N-acetyltransferase, partial [Gemmatimonadota bacterium]
MRLKTLTAADIETLRPSLTALLADTVANGASIGFYPPVGGADADRYWREVEQGIRDGKRVVIAAFDQRGVLLGSGQIALESRDNGLHRAEVQKVMVALLARRQGVGRALMMALEQSAREAGRTLLVLDTREGDP